MHHQRSAPQQIDIATLERRSRILLTTDGTLTDTLQAYFNDPIGLVKLDERTFQATEPIEWLDVAREDVIERHILLRGASGRTYVYAVSVVLVDRIDPAMKDALMHTDTPLGRLWLEHRMETFKEIVEMGREPAGERSIHFGIQPTETLLYRTYRVYSKQRFVIRITEYFPEDAPDT